MPAIVSPGADPARIAIQRLAPFIRRLTLLGLLSLPAGCSSDIMTPDQANASNRADSVRVIVTLAPAPNKAVNEAGVDAAIEYLRARYPEARIVRAMPDFSQLLVELPSRELDALATDSLVLSAKPDSSHRTTEPHP